MTDIIVKISKETRMVDVSRSFIGNDGENLQGNIVFEFKDEFVDGVARLEYEIQGEKRYLMLEKVENGYKMPIKSVLTKKGNFEMQMVITENDEMERIPIFKSNVFYVYCNKSINAEIEQPDEYPQWIEIANKKIIEIEEAIKNVEELKDYNVLNNKPSINDIELSGNKTLDDLGIQEKGDYVEDTNYVHTDNNYTNEDKSKLASLNNYDDSLIQQEITSVVGIVEQNTRDISNIDNKVSALGEKTEEIEIDIIDLEASIDYLKENKANKSEIPDISGKQDKLVAGNNIKIEGNVISATGGGEGGTSNYNDLTNKPKINGIELSENKTTEQLGINIPDVSNFITKDVNNLTNYNTKSDISTILYDYITSNDLEEALNDYATKNDVPKNVSQLNNDSNYITEDVLDGKGYLTSIPSEYIKNTDYASTDKFGIVRTKNLYGVQTLQSGDLAGVVKTYNDYVNGFPSIGLVTKETLENVISGKDLTNKSYVDGLVGDIETLLENIDTGSGV